MNFPFNAFHEFGLDATLLISLMIGFGFGFMLENGGFGSSKVLAGIFYGKDWRVLKVMFSAIVTAMLGLYAVQGMGWIAMDQIAFRPTYLGGQVVGGLLLGFGFVTAGYCPGTSVVGIVSGKLDAVFAMFGMLIGIGVFEEAFSVFAGVRDWGDMGIVSLSDWMGISNGFIVLMVVAMAVGAFSVVGYFERKVKREALPRRAYASVGVTVMGAALVAVVQFIGPGDARAMGVVEVNASAPAIEAVELAELAVEGRSDYLIMDLRQVDSMAIELPGAWNVDAATLINQRTCPDLPSDRRLILVDDQDLGKAREVAFALRRKGLDAVVLEGGARAWDSQVLQETGMAAAAQSYRMMMNGKSPILDGAAPPPVPKENAAPPKREGKKGGGCS
jgi:uncharacterized protein